MPDCRHPHTYIFVKVGTSAPHVEGEGPKTQGGGFFRPDAEWHSPIAVPGELGVWVTTARIFARKGVNSMLGKIVRAVPGCDSTRGPLMWDGVEPAYLHI